MTPRIKDRWDKALFCPVSSHCFKGLQPLTKKYKTVHYLALKPTDVYVPCLPKRKAFQVHIFLLHIYKPEDRPKHLPTLKMRLSATKVNRF